MEPRAQGVAHPERPSFARQDQEGGLESVLRILLVAKDCAANAEHERTVPLDEGGEGQLGRLASTRREPLQQLAIGRSSDRPEIKQRAELSRDAAVLPDPHWPNPPGSCHVSTI
jgi:hypothetical protein